MTGKWVPGASAGGSPSHPTFYTNPQYQLIVGGAASVNSMVSVHIQAFCLKEVCDL